MKTKKTANDLNARVAQFSKDFQPWIRERLSKSYSFEDEDWRDVFQNILLALLRDMPRFRYDAAKNGPFHEYVLDVGRVQCEEMATTIRRHHGANMDVVAADQLFMGSMEKPTPAQAKELETSVRKLYLSMATQRFFDDPEVPELTKAVARRCLISPKPDELPAVAAELGKTKAELAQHLETARKALRARTLALLKNYPNEM